MNKSSELTKALDALGMPAEQLKSFVESALFSDKPFSTKEEIDAQEIIGKLLVHASSEGKDAEELSYQQSC
jgi:hypothetical protein